jgi:hypothetical protein
MGTKERRREQFVNPELSCFVHVRMSRSLIECAESSVKLCFSGRRGTEENWISSHTLAVVLLTAAAFEAWVNESLFSSTSLGEKFRRDFKRIASMETVEQRYRGLVKIASGREPDASALGLLMLLRNEIAHYLPRPVKNGVPEWLSELDNQDLFLRLAESPADDLVYGQKLESFKLARWATETAAHAADALAAALNANPRGIRIAYADEFHRLSDAART